jgi:hypothetical protein
VSSRREGIPIKSIKYFLVFLWKAYFMCNGAKVFIISCKKYL